MLLALSVAATLVSAEVAIPAGLYTFGEIAVALSTRERTVELSAGLADRAAVVCLKARRQEQAVRVIAKALDLSVEPTKQGYRLIRDPQVLAWEKRLQEAYVADLVRLYQARAGQLRKVMAMSRNEAEDALARVELLSGMPSLTAEERHELTTLLGPVRDLQRMALPGGYKDGLTTLFANLGRIDTRVLFERLRFPVRTSELSPDQREAVQKLDQAGGGRAAVYVHAPRLGLLVVLGAEGPGGSEMHMGDVVVSIQGTDPVAAVYNGSKQSHPVENLGLGPEARTWLAESRAGTNRLIEGRLSKSGVRATRSDDCLSAIILRWTQTTGEEVAMELAPSDETHVWFREDPEFRDVVIGRAIETEGWVASDFEGLIAIRNPMRFLTEPRRRPLDRLITLLRATRDAVWPGEQLLSTPALYKVPAYSDLARFFAATWANPSQGIEIPAPNVARYYGIGFRTLALNAPLTYYYASLPAGERQRLLARPSGNAVYPMRGFSDEVHRRAAQMNLPGMQSNRARSGNLYIRWTSTEVPGERVVSLYRGESDLAMPKYVDGKQMVVPLESGRMYPWAFREKAESTGVPKRA
jgi:hypothetical protein